MTVRIAKGAALASVTLLASALCLPGTVRAVALHGGRIAKVCAGPTEVDPRACVGGADGGTQCGDDSDCSGSGTCGAKGRARIGDVVVCEVRIENLDENAGHFLCVDSITDVIRGRCSDSGILCTGDDDCVPAGTCTAPVPLSSGELVPAGRMGVCDGGANAHQPCAEDADCGGGFVCGPYCRAGVSAGQPCVDDNDCSGGTCETCAGFLLGDIDAPEKRTVAVEHEFAIRQADADAGGEVRGDADADGVDIGTGLPFSLSFPGIVRIISCVHDADCGDAECNRCSTETNECEFIPSATQCTDTDGNACTVAGCDGAGRCDQLNVLATEGTACEDTDGDACTVAGCDGAGSCEQSHDVVSCSSPIDPECDTGETCNPGTGLCERQYVPEGEPCTDTDGNACTVAGCDGAGRCDQLNVLATEGTACEDTDGDACTVAGCDGAGSCEQSHDVVSCRSPIDPECDAGETCNPGTGLCERQYVPEGEPCTDTDGNACTVAGCDGAGRCDQLNVLATEGTACEDTDGNACTVAGCDSTGMCDQSHMPAPGGTHCPNTDDNACTTAGCDGAGRCEQSHTLIADGAPCPDTDGNACTTAACDGSGACEQSHDVVSCSSPIDPECDAGETCNPSTGLCETNYLPSSEPCLDTDDNECTEAGCNGAGSCDQSHLFAPEGTQCTDTDGDSCTTAECDGVGTCDQEHVVDTTSPECVLDCGDDIMDQCVVKVSGLADVFCGPPPLTDPNPECTVTVDDVSKRALQEAIDAARDGVGATITVEGRCLGPIRVIGRNDLTIQGVPPPAGVCETDVSTPRPGDRGPGPADLLSTLAGGCDSTNPSDCELIKMTRSTNVTVQYLNIVESVNSGLEYKRSADGVAFCNCVARNAEEGIEFDKGRGGHVALQNLVKDNAVIEEDDEDPGIGVHDTTDCAIRANTVVSNRRGGIWLQSEANQNRVEFNVVRGNSLDGVRVENSSENTLSDNAVMRSDGDGIRLQSAVSNRVTENIVEENEAGGVSLHDADDGLVDGNVIRSNGDGLTDEILCGAGSTGNTGSNVPDGSPCGP